MEQTSKMSPLAVLGAVTLTLGLGFVVARSFGERSQPKQTAPIAAQQPAPVRRFKVPVTSKMPAQGSNEALVTIVEWCDLRGKACRDVDGPLRALMHEYEGQLRWVHRHLPDPDRYEESKKIHELARSVFLEEGDAKFWSLRERLLALPDDKAIGEPELKAICQELKIDYERASRSGNADKFSVGVGIDVGLAGRFGVQKSPAVFVNGRPVAAGLSPAELKSETKKLILEEMEHANQVLAGGVPPAQLYDRITEDGLWHVDDNPALRQAASSMKPRLVLAQPVEK